MIFHIHAKDTYLDRSNTERNGVLNTKPTAATRTGPGRFARSGSVKEEKVWRDMISALRTVGTTASISIEHEDGLLSVDEGLSKAVEFLGVAY